MNMFAGGMYRDTNAHTHTRTHTYTLETAENPVVGVVSFCSARPGQRLYWCILNEDIFFNNYLPERERSVAGSIDTVRG